jgi:integrase/recombinase XerD
MKPCSAVGMDERFAGWIRHMQSQGLGERSIETYVLGLRQFLTYCQYKKVAVEAVDWRFLEGWINHLKEAKRAATTINGRLQAVGIFFEYLMRLGDVKHNPRRDVRSLKVVRKLPEYFTEEGAYKMLRAGHTTVESAVIETLYGGGLRCMEVCGLNTQDVLWDQAILRVLGKGNRQRLVPVPVDCLNAIRAYLPDREWRLQKAKKPKSEGALFINVHGRRFGDHGIQGIVSRVAKRAGIEQRVYPHLFRHSYATHLYNNGADIKAVQELLGHLHVQTTEIYTHVAYKKLAMTVTKYHPRSGTPPCQSAS